MYPAGPAVRIILSPLQIVSAVALVESDAKGVSPKKSTPITILSVYVQAPIVAVTVIISPSSICPAVSVAVLLRTLFGDGPTVLPSQVKV